MFVLRNKIILKLSKKRNPCRAGESHPKKAAERLPFFVSFAIFASKHIDYG